MSASVGLLGYFILEASELVEQLDAAVAASGATGPDAGNFTRIARKLRGSATMARLTGMAELGAAIERVGRALRDGNVNWSPAVRSALVAAIDDVRTLLRAVRNWGLEEDARVSTRVAELQRYTPVSRLAAAPLGASPSGAPIAPAAPAAPAVSAALYVAQGATDAATALEGALARVDDRQAFVAAMGRVRALRGFAAVRDVPAVGEVVDALDRLSKPVEHDGAHVGAAEQAVLGQAVSVLRQAASDLRAGREADAGATALPAFADAVASLDDRRPAADRVVPVAQLFHDDAGPHLVARAPNPPTTPASRFRMEAVSLAEHLRRAVAVARASDAANGRDRALRELRQALRSLGESASSFGEESTVRFVRAVAAGATSLDQTALDALDEGARALADGRSSPAEVSRLLDEAGARAAEAATHTRSRMETPTGRQLHALLESGIVEIDRLNAEPLTTPAPVAEDAADGGVVPIERLLYRGRAALMRARALREELRVRGTEPTPDDVAELFDLLDLAAE